MPARSKNPLIKTNKPASLKELAASSTLQPGKIAKYSAYPSANSFKSNTIGTFNYKGGAAVSPPGSTDYTMDFSLDFTS